MRLGLSSYTFNWWSASKAGLSPEQLLDSAIEHRVEVIQIADNMPVDDLSPHRLDALAQRACNACIVIETGTRGVDPPHLRKHLDIARRLHAPLLRTIIDTTEAQAIESLRILAPEFERAGVILGIENHDRFPAVSFHRIVEQIGSPAIGICLDTANSLGCGEDIHTVLHQLGPYVVNLHLKDFRIERLPHSKGFLVTGCPAGKGLLDIPAVLARVPNHVSCILELWSEPLETVELSITRENNWARESLHYLRPLITRES